MSSAAAISTADFDQQVLQSEIPVLVDFWAVWCPPCRALSPTIDALAQEYQGRLKVLKLNIDEEPQLATRFGIRSIPTLLLFKNGQKVSEMIGAYPKDAISRLLDESL